MAEFILDSFLFLTIHLFFSFHLCIFILSLLTLFYFTFSLLSTIFFYCFYYTFLVRISLACLGGYRTGDFV